MYHAAEDVGAVFFGAHPVRMSRTGEGGFQTWATQITQIIAGRIGNRRHDAPVGLRECRAAKVFVDHQYRWLDREIGDDCSADAEYKKQQPFTQAIEFQGVQRYGDHETRQYPDIFDRQVTQYRCR